MWKNYCLLTRLPFFRDSLAPIAPFRLIMPYLFNFGSARFRRWVVEHAPFYFVQHPRRIIDTIALETDKILETKKRALEQEDKVVLEQVGEGRDILSTLRGYSNVPHDDPMDLLSPLVK